MPQSEIGPLKVDLPDLFAYAADESKAKLPQRRKSKTRIDEQDGLSVTRGSVLLVESDDEVARLVTRILNYEGYQVTRATCMAEAEPMLEQGRCDFLLARRLSVPSNAGTGEILKRVERQTIVRIVDNFTDLMLGQVIDYDSMSLTFQGVLDFLTSQLEGTDARNRGHAQSVARYCRLVGQRIGLPRRELDTLCVGALLHDIESLVMTHRISPVVREGGATRLPSYQRTLRLLAHTPFPYPLQEFFELASNPSPVSLHDRDAAHKNLTLAAHILRVADVYDTLRRETLIEMGDRDEVVEWMRKQPSGTFDANALEVFIHIRKNERMLSAMDLFRASILMVDADAEYMNQLELRLENEDYRVIKTTTVEAALQALQSENITLVLSELVFPGNDDGFRLLKAVKQDVSYRHIPVLFHAPEDSARMKQALELGAEDWIAKPHSIEILTIKLDRLISRLRSDPNSRIEGVRGSIEDMGIIEMVQILSAGSRSVQIQIEKNGGTAEMIMQKGRIVAATLGRLTGDEAAIEILLWESGSFCISPLRITPTTTVTMSTENLIMQSAFQKDTRAAASESAADGMSS